jgi:hypothetical protein
MPFHADTLSTLQRKADPASSSRRKYLSLKQPGRKNRMQGEGWSHSKPKNSSLSYFTLPLIFLSHFAQKALQSTIPLFCDGLSQ